MPSWVLMLVSLSWMLALPVVATAKDLTEDGGPDLDSSIEPESYEVARLPLPENDDFGRLHSGRVVVRGAEEGHDARPVVTRGEWLVWPWTTRDQSTEQIAPDDPPSGMYPRWELRRSSLRSFPPFGSRDLSPRGASRSTNPKEVKY